MCPKAGGVPAAVSQRLFAYQHREGSQVRVLERLKGVAQQLPQNKGLDLDLTVDTWELQNLLSGRDWPVPRLGEQPAPIMPELPKVA